MKTTIIYSLCLLCLLTACETYVDYKGEITEPLLVVFAQAAADDTLTCSVAQSRFFLDQPDTALHGTDLLLKDAVVSWQINDGPICRHSDTTIIPHAGDKIMLQVEHSAYPTAHATQNVPYPVNFGISRLEFNANTITFNITLDNYPGEKSDVFALEVYADVYDEENDSSFTAGPLYLESNDTLFDSLNAKEKGLIGVIAGFRETLYVAAGEVPGQASLTVYKNHKEDSIAAIHVYAHSITQDYYRYALTTKESGGFSGNIIGFGIEEKVQIYSNLTNAIGIFAAVNTNMQTINNQ